MNVNLTVIIPIYNDEQVLNELIQRLQNVLIRISLNSEIILIDDGSSDNSFVKMQQLKEKNKNLTLVKLTRNFGQINAITAGLDIAKYENIVLMDSDLQDPPELIEDMLNSYLSQECDMIIAKRETREDSFFKKIVSKLFNNTVYYFTNVKIEKGLGVFRIMRKETYEKVKNLKEVTSSKLSLLYWSGFNYKTIPLKRDKRFAGKSGYTLRKMFNIALDRLFSYSLWPLRAASIIGVLTSFFSFFYGVVIIIKKLFMAITVPGWTTYIVLLLFLFGINFIILGIIGEYIGRIYLETKQRPLYVVAKIIQ